MPGYNERAWAIDIISEINRIVGMQQMPICRAGGEYSVRETGGHLFPDVLLFKDTKGAVILQGWELKFPDTDIRDVELFDNAKRKADALGLGSFLLWNVTYAELYTRRAGAFGRTPIARWDVLSDVRTRDQVKPAEDRWKALLAQIIADLNDRFARNEIEGRPFVEAYQSGGVVDLILANQGLLVESLEHHVAANSALEADVTLWWEAIKQEHSGGFKKPTPALSRLILVNWIGKFLLAHLLMQQDQRVRQTLDEDALSTPSAALDVFGKLSESNDFWTVFGPLLAQQYTDSESWSHLCEFNRLLGDLRVGGIDQSQLIALLEETVDVGKRKLRGQYTTPVPLAQLLVRLALDDKSGAVGDFCCGTGTIPRAAIKVKGEYGIDAADAVKQVWASDRFMEPLQLATLAMASAAPMSSVLQVFRESAFDLDAGYTAILHDPHDGNEVRRPLPQLDAIASNLPFVDQNGRSGYQQQIEQVNAWLEENGMRRLSGTSDVAAYFPFALWRLLRPGGRMALIVTASWINTDWTEEFRDALLRCFNLHAVVVSGCGRWFQNADVVTHVLLLEKRDNICQPPDAEPVCFCALQQPLEDIADGDASKAAAACILSRRGLADQMNVRTQPHNRLGQITSLGLGWNAQFVDCDWATDLDLVEVRAMFDMGRGERRGWNPMFYPDGNHGIEPEYLTPVLRTSASVRGYTADPDRIAFTCSQSVDLLEQCGHEGALAWIRRFEDQTNSTGVPLVESLSRARHYWYEMKPDTTADMVIPINFGDRLFLPRLRCRSFVDQRLSYLRAKEGVDLDLCHALLNGVTSYFWFEGMGFGRGLGALDLNARKFKTRLRMLNPGRLDQDQRNEIVRLFTPVRSRNVMRLPDELGAQDRMAFDRTLLAAYGIEYLYERIKTALLTLYGIRKAAAQN